jgi:hypothetical protein
MADRAAPGSLLAGRPIETDRPAALAQRGVLLGAELGGVGGAVPQLVARARAVANE